LLLDEYPSRIDTKQILNQRDQSLAVVVQKTEVTRSAKAFGQDMLQDQPQKLGPGYHPGLGAFALGVFVAKGDLPLPDHTAVQIAPEIYSKW
jgi:hypothetical protein